VGVGEVGGRGELKGGKKKRKSENEWVIDGQQKKSSDK